jgi:hypothetical protein
MNSLKKNKFILFLYFIIFFIFYTIFNQIPLKVIPGPVDDLLYLNNAISILKGSWIGDYNQYTLAKGIGYPVTLAISYILDIDVKKFEFIIYSLSALFFSLTITKYYKNYLLGLVFFVFILANPYLYDHQMARLIREFVYSSYLLFVLTIIIQLFFINNERVFNIIYSIALGFFFFMTYITREESIWIIFSVIFSVIIFLISNVYFKKNFYFNKSLLRFLLISLITFIVLINGVNTLNFVNYQKYLNNEFSSSYFSKAYGSLISIDHNNYQKWNPLPKTKRLKAYRASPTFAKLEKFLEGEVGKSWSSLLTGKPNKDYDATYWTMWSIRDAASKLGIYRNASESNDFYKSIYLEIKEACTNSKELNCADLRNGLIPPFPKSEYMNISKTFFFGLKKFFLFDFNFSNFPIYSTDKHFEEFELIFRSFNSNIAIEVPENKNFTTFKGWIASKKEIENNFQFIKDSNQQKFSIQFSNASDVKEYFKTQEISKFKYFKRFTLKSICDDCEIFFSNYNITNKLKEINAGNLISTSDIVIYKDSLQNIDINQQIQLKSKTYLGIYNFFAKVIKIISPLFLITIVSSLFLILRDSQSNLSRFLFIFLTTLIISRIGMLAIIEELVFVNNISILRLYPASPFLMILIGLSFYKIIKLFTDYQQSQK